MPDVAKGRTLTDAAPAGRARPLEMRLHCVADQADAPAGIGTPHDDHQGVLTGFFCTGVRFLPTQSEAEFPVSLVRP